MRKLMNAFFIAAGLLFTANIASAQQKLAHLNSANIIEAMPEVKTAQTTLEAFRKTKSGDIDKMIAEYQTTLAGAQAKEKTRSEANKETVDKELQTMGGQLQDLQKRIEDARAKAQQELEQKNQELFTPIQAKADAAIKAVSKERGYTYVFDTANQGLVYWDGGEDITALVKTKLGIPATAAVAPKK
ncbi:OmpH family outer membrane protein [Pedobacter metabolipauper]|uniref:Periplasmic chaperone for outer membrane proteins Skp n=1 Tax=Pedobacter metabolipauper TaxID=425513 RepID=A0A4R6SUB2_9SPHI|nr:OmpH family outer membrane protein [Pedobacter metabolipauper]TDQ07377.1 periplasmic chaperone for outer membrane proteins Skp [Pedobacter metabolipauper]